MIVFRLGKCWKALLPDIITLLFLSILAGTYFAKRGWAFVAKKSGKAISVPANVSGSVEPPEPLQAPVMAATNFQSLIRVALFSFLCAFDINRRIQIAPRLPNDVRGNALGFCNGTLSHGVAVLFRPRATKLNLTTSAGFNKTKSALNKPSKRGFTSLAIPGHDPPIDLTIFVDIAVNPGPSPTLVRPSF